MKSSAGLRVIRQVVVLLLFISIVPGSVFAGVQAVTARDGNTTEEVRAFVAKALAYARSRGRDEALKAFTQPGGEFHENGLYIYAYDFTGTVIAHGGDASLVGKNLIGMKDLHGVAVISELISLAKQGEGWLFYTWPNPEHEGRQEPKLGFVARVDDNWFLGSGTYGRAAARQ